MSNKKQKTRSKGNKGSKSNKKQGNADASYGLQAIIFADSYRHQRFRPITHDIPKMLIPVAGCPMINYSIDLLIHSNVHEIYIICSSHAAQLEEYVQTSQWQNIHWYPKLKIHIEQVPDCKSVGEALRHMHTLNYIQSKTFILCHGDIVANISLTDIIEKHKQRTHNNPNTLMTCLFKNADYKQRSQSLEDDLFIITNDDNELLQYSNDRLSDKLSFDLSIFDIDEDIEITHNLIDCGIDICSKAVLSLFEDNFDYDSIRGELFEGVIRSEIYNYKIYASFLCNEKSEYATRILDWRSYNGITMDIIERWTYPLVLDSNTVTHSYMFERNNIYKEDNVKIGIGTEIKRNSILGYETQIGNKCLIDKSVIGQQCIIGNNVTIHNCYIFGDCVIGHNTILTGAVIANNVVIGNDCNIPKGCILSFGVEIDNNIALKQYTKLALLPYAYSQDQNDEFSLGFGNDSEMSLPAQHRKNKQSPKGRVRAMSDTNVTANNSSSTLMGIMQNSDIKSNNNDTVNDIGYDLDIVGKDGKGFLYEIKDSDDSYVLDSINNVLAIESDRPQRGYSVVQQSEITDSIIDKPIGNGTEIVMKDTDTKHTNDMNKLVSEISECIESAESNENTAMSDVVFEITMSVRLAHNASLEDFSCAVFLAILNRIRDEESFGEKKEKIEYCVMKYCVLFEKLVKGESEHIKIINGLYRACNTRSKGLIYFFLEALDKLFYEDLIPLTSIQKWNQTRNESKDEKFDQYLAQYIEGWIDAEVSDEDDEDSESESD